MDRWQVPLGVLTGLLVVYLALLLGLWVDARRHPDTVGFTDALRLLPDLLRVLRRLVADPAVPVAVRWKLGLLLVYLLLPLDVVPDFLPVIGQADDIIILAFVQRSALRSAGPEPLRRHCRAATPDWPSSNGWRVCPMPVKAVNTCAGSPVPGRGNASATR